MLEINLVRSPAQPSFTTGSTRNGMACTALKMPISNPSQRCSTFSFSWPTPVTKLTRLAFMPSANTNGTMATAIMPARPESGGGPSSGERA